MNKSKLYTLLYCSYSLMLLIISILFWMFSGNIYTVCLDDIELEFTVISLIFLTIVSLSMAIIEKLIDVNNKRA